jgi:hypothetical protein
MGITDAGQPDDGSRRIPESRNSGNAATPILEQAIAQADLA